MEDEGNQGLRQREMLLRMDINDYMTYDCARDNHQEGREDS